MLAFVVGVTLIDWLNVLQYWTQQAVFPPDVLQRIAWGGAALALALGLVLAVWMTGAYRRGSGDVAIPALPTIVGMWMITVLSIAKEVVPIGWKRWEITYTLFVIELVILTVWMAWLCRKPSAAVA